VGFRVKNKGISSSTLQAYSWAIATIFSCQSLLANPTGHGVGWGVSQLSPGIVVTNITARGGQNLGLRSDGSIIAWGGNPDVPRSAQDTVAVAIGGPASGSYSFYLALRTNGTVAGWGDNTYGQITPPAGLSNVVAIAAGGYHSLALKSDGTVVAWGSNIEHQSNVPPNLSNVVAIAAGEFFSMALKYDGTAVSWGSPHPVPPDATNLTAIAAFSGYSIAVKSNGEVKVWQFNGGYLPTPSLSNIVTVAISGDSAGYHAQALGSNGTVYTWSDNIYDPSGFPAGLSNVVAIAAGSHHSLALQKNGNVVCWGDNSAGQTNFPAPVNDVIAVSAGALYNLALKRDATVFDWAGSQTLPPGLSNITAVAAGIGNGLALKKNGTVVAWGNNQYLQTYVPAGLNGVVAIAMSTYHGLAVKSNGTVVAWGLPPSGTGPGAGALPGNLTNVIAVSASPWIDSSVGGAASPGDFALALKGDGTVMGWGYSPPPGNIGPANVPADLSNIIAISAGGGHGLALKNYSTVIGWGFNHHGEATGVPNLTSPYASTGQVMIAGQVLSNVIAIAAGFKHSLALKNDGTVVAWGTNVDGEATVPSGVSNVVAIAAGFYQSLAITADVKIDSIQSRLDGLAIGFHTFAGRQYSVEFSPDLIPPNWLPLPGGNVLGNGQDVQVIDSSPANDTRFYRLKVTQ
jgi:alpha-tubulin suppressor-like RCC1 family protein